jgi:hypothetical protein
MAEPPTKDQAKQELIKLLEEDAGNDEKMELLGYLRTSTVDLPWVLSLIRRLKDDHPYFNEGYTRSIKRRATARPEQSAALEKYRG